MALIQGIVDDYDAAGIVHEDLSDQIKFIDKFDTPFISLLPVEDCHNTYFQWADRKLKPLAALLTGQISANTNTFMIEETTSMTFITDDIVQIANASTSTEAPELIRITSANPASNTCDCSRYYAGSPTGIHTVGASVELIGNARLSGATFLGSLVQADTSRTNEIQLLDETIEVSTLANAQRYAGREVLMQRLTREGIQIFKQKCERAALLGGKVAGTASVPGTMDGLLRFIAANGTWYNGPANGGNATQTYIAFNNFMATLAESVQAPNTVVVDTTGLTTIAYWAAALLRNNKPGKAVRWGVQVPSLLTAAGNVAVIWDRHLKWAHTGIQVFLRDSDVILKELLPMDIVEEGRTKHAVKKVIAWAIGLMCYNSAEMAIIDNISGGA